MSRQRRDCRISTLTELFSLTVFIRHHSTYNLNRFTISQLFSIHYYIETVSVILYYFNSIFFLSINFFQLMGAQNTIVTQLTQTVRGTIFAIARKLNNRNSTCHIITPQIITAINYPRQFYCSQVNT